MVNVEWRREVVRVGAFGIMLFLGLAVIGATVALWAAPGDVPFAIKVIGGLWFGALFFYQIALKEKRERAIVTDTIDRLRAAEDEFRRNPRPQAVWDVARMQLESYVNRVFIAVRHVLYVTIAAILVGWALIVAGVVLAFRDPDALTPAVLAAASGILSQFIGTTFLLIHKSVVKQSSDVVNLLERLTAVGMSVQILQETAGLDPSTAASARIALAQDLLKLYGSKN